MYFPSLFIVCHLSIFAVCLLAAAKIITIAQTQLLLRILSPISSNLCGSSYEVVVIADCFRAFVLVRTSTHSSKLNQFAKTPPSHPVFTKMVKLTFATLPDDPRFIPIPKITDEDVSLIRGPSWLTTNILEWIFRQIDPFFGSTAVAGEHLAPLSFETTLASCLATLKKAKRTLIERGSEG